MFQVGCYISHLSGRQSRGQKIKLSKMLRNWNFSTITFPTQLKDIHTFEKQNSIAINVYGYEKHVYPLRINEQIYATQINLLLISDGEKQHYCGIKNFSRLLSSQVSKHDGKKFFCPRCLNPFGKENVMQEHLEYYCSTKEAVKTEYPKKERSSNSKISQDL
jgi:hypothetical protein